MNVRAGVKRRWGSPLPRSFYARRTLVVARALLGRVLVCGRGRNRVAGRIVEVEAYRGAADPASHAYRGPTPRTAVMFGPAGHAYVYFTYGMHYCLNLVTEAEGVAAAVLLRALEPLEGQALMRRRRAPAGRPPANAALARGPGNLARALGLTTKDTGLDLVRGPLWVSDLATHRGGRRILALPRVGIRVATERRWRFLLEGHPSASAPRRAPKRAGRRAGRRAGPSQSRDRR
ncbi:MAG: DNA-3-methyladenine glycosylase [Candidatus Eiseniibacteriota bacterium]